VYAEHLKVELVRSGYRLRQLLSGWYPERKISKSGIRPTKGSFSPGGRRQRTAGITEADAEGLITMLQGSAEDLIAMIRVNAEGLIATILVNAAVIETGINGLS
jgi:hypothetical protein